MNRPISTKFTERLYKIGQVVMAYPSSISLSLIYQQYWFYDRETNSAAFYVIPNFYHTPLPFYVTQIINTFLNSIISANNEKGKEFQPVVKPYTPYFSSSVDSLLYQDSILK